MEWVPSSRSLATVLLVEDNPADAQLAQFALGESGLSARLVVAESATAVLERLGAGERPNLVLLDLDLDGSSGLELLSRLRSDAILRHLPVIILSNSSCWQERMRALKLGAIDYWIKPTSFERFIDMMARLRRYLQPQDSRAV